MLDYEAIIRSQAQRYKLIAPQDICKAIYQATMGPGHIIEDEQGASALIREEAAQAAPHTSEALFEPLGGRFLRLHLGGLNCSGLSVDTLAKMFVVSGRILAGTQIELEAGVSAMIKLADEGALPFSADEARAFADTWRSSGFRPIHHSEQFRSTYFPSYRVLADQSMSILPLLYRLDARLREGSRTVLAIDGMCCAGKTTLAGLLQYIYGCAVFHADDFFPRPEQRTPARFRQPGGNLDLERLREEVLLPLSGGADEITFRRFDCSEMALSEPITCPVGQLVIVEGSYTMHPELMRYFTDSVFIHISPEEQHDRVIAREGGADAAAPFFERWIPLENEYIVGTQANRRCEFLLEARDISATFKPGRELI